MFAKDTPEGRDLIMSLLDKPDGASYKVVCPKCEDQRIRYFENGARRHDLNCEKCGTDFQSELVKIRAKRSRGSRRDNNRNFSIRVYYTDGEEGLIEFENAIYEDFELRSRDVVIFSYLNDVVRLVQNLSITSYFVVSKPSCYLASYVYGQDSHEVKTLRTFRDNVLLPSNFYGLVKIYYRVSPILIYRFSNNSIFNRLVRFALTPLVWILR